MSPSHRAVTSRPTHRLQPVVGQAEDGEALDEGGALQSVGVIRLQQITIQIESRQRLVTGEVADHCAETGQPANRADGYWGDQNRIN